MDVDSTIDQILELEQYYIDTLPTNLNIDRVASGSGHHGPMSEAAKLKLRKLRGQPFYVYDVTSQSLIFLFDSKQFAYDSINIDHRTLSKCLLDGKLYLDRFLFSLDLISEFSFETILSLDSFKLLLKKHRSNFTIKQPASKLFLAENILDPKKTKLYSSINEFAKSIKGDRGTIRKYLNGQKEGVYKGIWKLTHIKD